MAVGVCCFLLALSCWCGFSSGFAGGSSAGAVCGAADGAVRESGTAAELTGCAEWRGHR